MDKLTYAQSLIDQGLDKENFILEMDKFDAQNIANDVECGEGFEKDENNNCVPVGKQNPAVNAVETVDVENTVEGPNGDLVSENILSVSSDGDPLKTNKGFVYTETEKPWEGNSWKENLAKISKDQGLNEEFFKDENNILRFVNVLEKEYADATEEKTIDQPKANWKGKPENYEKDLARSVESIRHWANQGYKYEYDEEGNVVDIIKPTQFFNGYDIKDENSGMQPKKIDGEINPLYLTYVRTHKDSYNITPEALRDDGFIDDNGYYTYDGQRAGLGKQGDKWNYEYWYDKAKRNSDGALYKTPINYKLDEEGDIINSDFNKKLSENSYVDQFGNPFNINPNFGEFLPTHVLNVNEQTGAVSYTHLTLPTKRIV